MDGTIQRRNQVETETAAADKLRSEGEAHALLVPNGMGQCVEAHLRVRMCVCAGVDAGERCSAASGSAPAAPPAAAALRAALVV